jgi:TonB-dependent SusC/RagA subfamily outer membrane receptor
MNRTNKFTKGIQDACRKKLAQIMALSVFLLLRGIGTVGARGGDIQATAEAQQQNKIRIAGTVVDSGGEPVIGANVVEKGFLTNGTTTDENGRFALEVSPRATLMVSYIGYVMQEVTADNRTDMRIEIREDTQALEEVTVVAFAKQKKESVIASITTVNPTALKVPSSNLTTALAGRISGIIAYQRSGEPGLDNADFFVRGITTFGYKKDPLILLDNNEISSTELARIQPDDMATFSIMKDAAATALYGSRGANGVIPVTTKEGTEGKAKLNFRFEESVSTPVRRVEPADPILYMRLHNEAVRTRAPLGSSLYSQSKIDNTERGVNPYVYPANDWYDILFKDLANSQRANFNLSGGRRIASYYIAGTFNNDNGNLKKVVDKMKFKGTYGLSGNDAIGSENDRFFYLSRVNMDDSNRGMSFGTYGNGYSLRGVSIGRYANENITWEVSRKMNLGMELNLLKKLEVQVDYFKEDRWNILMDRSYIPATMGLQSAIKANVGEASSHGMNMSVDYTHSINASKNFWVQGRANFTYATSEFRVYDEPDYSDTPWKSRVGTSLNQQWGYVAERLFVDEEEVRNSPAQFGDYMAGDIKYKDINEDGKITELDQVPIGYPTSPEIVYGFSVSTGYRNLDVSCFFQGLTRESFWIDVNATAPFIDQQRALLKVYADDHWSEDNRNLRALYPRLSGTHITF